MKPTKPLAAVAYEAIKRDVVRGALAPDTQMTESELAERYRIGRTPVREALNRLVQEHLVRVLPHRGYFVAPISIQDVRDLYEVRLLLEVEAVRMAAGQVDPARLRSLNELCQAGYDPADPDSVEGFLRLNTEFHVTVARASGNRRLADLLTPLLDEMERLMHVGLRLRNRTFEMAHEHKDLVEALVAGDREAAAQIATAQIHSSEKMVFAALMREPITEVLPAGLPS